MKKYMGIVYKTVKRYCNNKNREDLIQEGVKGLLYASKNLKYGVFEVYATVCVRRFILDFLYKDKVITGRTNIKTVNIDDYKLGVRYDGSEWVDLWDDLNFIIETQMDKIIITKRIEGYNDTEIAKELGCSISKVTRARRSLEARYREIGIRA